jgi:hypothetical protein
MTVLLVGGDQLGNIPRELEEYGCEEIIHWKGRKNSDKKRSIPQNVDMVLVLHDFVNHSLMDAVKEQAKRRRLPILFSRRGTVEVKQVLGKKKG